MEKKVKKTWRSKKSLSAELKKNLTRDYFRPVLPAEYKVYRVVKGPNTKVVSQ